MAGVRFFLVSLLILKGAHHFSRDSRRDWIFPSAYSAPAPRGSRFLLLDLERSEVFSELADGIFLIDKRYLLDPFADAFVAQRRETLWGAL